MGTVVSRLSWVEWDASMAIAARATRSFAQSAVAVLIAIYLGLHGFSLVQVGTFLTVGAVGRRCRGGGAGGCCRATPDARNPERSHGTRRDRARRQRELPPPAPRCLCGEPQRVRWGRRDSAARTGGPGRLYDPATAHGSLALGSIAGTIAGSLGALAAGVPTLLQRTFGLGELASFRPMFVAYAVLALLTALFYSRLSSRVELSSGEARWTNPFTLPSRGRIFTLAGLFTVDSFGTGLIVRAWCPTGFSRASDSSPAPWGPCSLRPAS